MKRRPYEKVRWTQSVENKLLLPEDIGLIYSSGELRSMHYVWEVKMGSRQRAQGDVLYGRCRDDLIDAQRTELGRLGVHVRLDGHFVRSKRHKRLGACNLYLTEQDEPVMFCFGNSESCAPYRKACAQTLMLITGATRCIESTLVGGGSGLIGHSSAVRVADRKAQRELLAMVGSFWRISRLPSREALFTASAESQATRKLRARGDLDLVESLDQARLDRLQIEAQVSGLELALLRRLRGAQRGLLSDGSSVVVTAVHRDAHYVGPSDYQRIRHVTEDGDDD